MPLHPGLVALALVAPEPMATSEARRLLPDRVPFAVAAHTGARSAMLPLALAGDTELLLPATEDLLHQPHRLAHTPDGAELLELLRAAGHAAFVSGAGPSLLVLCPRPAAPGALADADRGPGHHRRRGLAGPPARAGPLRRPRRLATRGTLPLKSRG